MGSHQSIYIRGAFFLTFAGLLSKILSAIYRIPLQNLTGDHGFYIYQQVYPLLGIMIILSLYGFPSAIAKIISELQQKDQKISISSTYRPLFLILFTFVSIVAVFLWINAHSFARIMNDHRLANAYKWVAVALFIIPFTSMLRGLFQGYQQLHVIAYSQIGEQFIRVTTIILVTILISKGYLDVYYMGSLGVLASVLGSIFACCILVLMRFKYDFFHRDRFQIPWGYYIKTLFIFGIVASLNHMILLILQFVDMFTFVPQMIAHNSSPVQAMESKGIFDRGQPLIQLGTVLGSSFALALIPKIAKDHIDRSIPMIRSSLKISFYLAIGAMIGLICIFKETNILLFKNAKGTSSLQVLSIAIFLSSLAITGTAILQSLGFYVRTGFFIFGSFLLKWFGNMMLIPVLGTLGASIATVLSLASLFIMIFWELKRQVPQLKVFQGIKVSSLSQAMTCMIGFIYIVKIILPYTLFSSRFGLLVYVVCLVAIGAFIYLLVLIRSYAFTKEEIKVFPFHSLLLRIYKR